MGNLEHLMNSRLCNGTTLQILSINHKVLKVKITNGSHIGNICKVVPLHSPELMSKFLNNITDALILSSNLCSGKPWTFNEFKITNGSHIGNIGLIPRIDLTPSEKSLHFRMKRRLCNDHQ